MLLVRPEWRYGSVWRGRGFLGTAARDASDRLANRI